MAKCKLCGSRIADGATKCPMCGASTGVSSQSGQSRPVQQMPPVRQSAPVQPAPQTEQQTPQYQQPAPQPVQQQVPRQQPAPSANQAEAATSVSYLVGQNAKIRSAADRIMDTYRIQTESTTNKKLGGTSDNISATARVIANMADSWEYVVSDIEQTKSYIASHQYNDAAWQSAVGDFQQNINIAVQGIKKMNSDCKGYAFMFPILLVLLVGGGIWVFSENYIFGLIWCLILIGPTFASIAVSFRAKKQKKRLSAFLQRIN